MRQKIGQEDQIETKNGPKMDQVGTKKDYGQKNGPKIGSTTNR